MRNLNSILLILATSCLALTLSSCGANNGTSGAGGCTPNVVDTGLQLAVTQITTIDYVMKLCANPATPGPFKVYGSNASQNLQVASINTDASKRTPTIADAMQSGATFQVRFNTSDTSFAIYMDKDMGNGTYGPDLTMPLVSPHPLPKVQ